VAQVIGRRTGCNDGPPPVDVVENAPSGARKGGIAWPT
jgi:hypothetical protein